MKLLSTACLILLFSINSFGQLEVIQYKLDNGLTVILNPDKNATSISGAVAVNTGSKNDPSDATGISHYLEHLLFKGTTELGTSDYASEKIHLDSIYYYYDELGKTKDTDTRNSLQQKINHHSIEASKYSMPNEFDKLLKSIGSSGVNATTNRDLTIYFNTFPSHQIQKWLNIYAHRFGNPVFRSFQSELEVVYEEKNRAMDNMQRRIMESFNQEFYAGHPYGENGTLGTIEHLKNPSLNKMYAYYNDYYVANNMALILTGNFEVDEIKPFIKEYFGKLKSGKLPDNKIDSPKRFEGRELVKTRITPIKVGIYGFRTVPSFHKDDAALEVASYLLQNEAGTGLIDELATNNKLMMAFAFSETSDEAGSQTFILIPKVLIQSLGKVEKLLFEQIEKLQNGNFSENLLASVKNEIYKDNQLQIEKTNRRIYLMADAFRAGKTWEQLLQELEAVQKVSKEDVQRVAKQYFGKNYLTFQSRMGFPKKEKLNKPPFEPLKVDQDRSSTYANRFDSIPELAPKVKYIDFETDVDITQLGDKSNLYVVKNPTNDIYDLQIKFHVGLIAEPKLEALERLMQYSCPQGDTLSAFKESIGVLGSALSFSTTSNTFIVSLRGIEKNLPELFQKLNDLFSAPYFSEKYLKTISNDFNTGRKLEEENAVLIAQAIAQYGLYGENSIYKNRLTVKEIEKLNLEDYASLWNEVKSKAVSIHFTGKTNSKKIKELITNTLELNLDAHSKIPYPLPLVKREQNEVVIVDNSKIVQSHLFFVKNSGVYHPENYGTIALFDQYFDGGFSGILTQEVREYRSLAYTSTANFDYTIAKSPESFFYTYIGTQADKTNASAELTYDLIQKMPQKPERMKDVKKNVILKKQADFPNFRSLSSAVENYLLIGQQKDPNELAANEYEKISFNDLITFYEKEIQSIPTFLGIHGDTKRFDISELEKIGPVSKLKREDVIRF